MDGQWRSYARQVIAEVVRGWQADGEPAGLDQRLRDAYPFGEHAHYPYQVWLKEQRATLALFGFITAPVPYRGYRLGGITGPLSGQTTLWEDLP